MKVRQLALCLAAAVVLGCTPAAAGEESPGRAGELVPKFAPKGQEDLQPKVMPSTEDMWEYWLLVE